MFDHPVEVVHDVVDHEGRVRWTEVIRVLWKQGPHRCPFFILIASLSPGEQDEAAWSSFLIARFWALRSSSGTAIVRRKSKRDDSRGKSQCRAVQVLKELEGQKYEDIAEILDVPIGTIRSRLHRARIELRELLDADQ
jgi:hypothetical protein